MHDVVYSVKQCEDNEELRYSLRSLENIPHGNIYIAGYKPTWVKNVIHVPNHQLRTYSKYLNSTNNWAAANAMDDLSDDYIYMNDDFFIMHKLETIPNMHMGSLDLFIDRYVSIGSRAYVEGSMTTRRVLHQIGVTGDLKSYELHVPFLVNKSRRRDIVALAQHYNPRQRSLHTRTLYGNYYQVEGIEMRDVKIHNESMQFSEKWDFLSTSDEAFSDCSVGDYIRDTFHIKSQFEV